MAPENRSLSHFLLLQMPEGWTIFAWLHMMATLAVVIFERGCVIDKRAVKGQEA